MKVISPSVAGTIKGFIETSFLDWPGKIASVIFLSGCNLRCPYCHNHALVLQPDSFQTIPRQWIADRLGDFKGWLDGLVISGGEPCLSPHLPELIEFFRKLSWPIKLDTNGTKPGILARLLGDGLLDYVAMDVKAPLDDIRYSRCAGAPIHISGIQKSLELLRQSAIDYELRMTVCPSLVKKKDIADLALQLEGVPLFVLQNFDPGEPLNPALKSISPYSKDILLEMKDILEKHVKECRLIC